ncbi:MAG: threonylcarbamoyl-AMP synthase [Lachnospiraceae bacterium]|nr:threonylcarbamoyl-AMP synthase [Lachnospiraceae bacterium]MDN4744297.1 L-threonylcarbamoyladenylate synthase [Lachnospiraceae bacterium C1.1]
METRVVKAYGDEEKDRELMKEAGDIIRAGGLVAMPTETVYGLAGDALNKESSKKIYAAKGRPSDNPLIVHIADIEALDKIVREVPEGAKALAEKYWPGPLTMVFKKSDIVPYETSGGLDTVAVRMPVNEISREFIRASGGYIAAPSANKSGRPSCTTAEHVLNDMKGEIALIIDGGAVGIGIESTIVDMTSETPCLLRPGYINIEMLEEVLGKIEVDPSIGGVMDASAHPKAPGMKYKHYAPKGELYIVEGDEKAVTEKINSLTEEAEKKGEKVAVIASDETKDLYNCDIIKDVGSRNDEESIAHNLFSVLRELDELEVSVIYTEAFDTPRMGMAIMNRLIRAAGHKIVKA